MRVIRQQIGADILCLDYNRQCLLLRQWSINQHKTKGIARFCFISQWLYVEAIVARRLKYIDSTGLHGWPCPITIRTSLFFKLAACLAYIAGSGKHHECLIESVFEHLPFQINQLVAVLPQISTPGGIRQGLHRKKDRSLIDIKNRSRLLEGRRIWRAAMAGIVAFATELAFPSHPGGGDYTGRLNYLYTGCSDLYPIFAVFLQVRFLHKQSPNLLFPRNIAVHPHACNDMLIYLLMILILTILRKKKAFSGEAKKGLLQFFPRFVLTPTSVLSYRFSSWLWIAVMTTVLKMSSTVQPRLKSLTGLFRPWSMGPMARAPVSRWTAL